MSIHIANRFFCGLLLCLINVGVAFAASSLHCPTKQALSQAIQQQKQQWENNCPHNAIPFLRIQDQGITWGIVGPGADAPETCKKMLDPSKYSFGFFQSNSAILLKSFDNDDTYSGYNCDYTTSNKNGGSELYVVGAMIENFKASVAPSGDWTKDAQGDIECHSSIPGNCLIFLD